MTRARWNLFGVAWTAAMTVVCLAGATLSAINHWTVATFVYSVCGLVFLSCTASWLKSRRELLTPIPPTNVRIVIRGVEIPVDCAYVGFDGDRHEWDVIVPPGLARDVTLTDVGAVHVDELPPRTSVTFTMVQLK
jgi:hypothetical protein